MQVAAQKHFPKGAQSWLILPDDRRIRTAFRPLRSHQPPQARTALQCRLSLDRAQGAGLPARAQTARAGGRSGEGGGDEPAGGPKSCAPGWTGPPFAKRSRAHAAPACVRAAASKVQLEAQRSPWEEAGLEALDYLRAGAANADTSGGQANTGLSQADADRNKPITFEPRRCYTRSMASPSLRREGN